MRRPAALALLSAALAAAATEVGATVVGATAAPGTQPPAQATARATPVGMLAFDVWNGTTHSIWVVSVKPGSQPRRLASGASDMMPSWSPSGREIAFSGVDVAGACALCSEVEIVAVPGGSLRQLTFGGTSGNPSWSPTGTLIAFTYNANAISAPTVDSLISPAGGERRVLVRSGRPGLSGLLGPPIWSPNGSKLALDTIDSGLYVIDVDGHGLRRIASGQIDGAAWSPDGDQLAFTRTTGSPMREPRSEIYVVDSDGRHLRRLTKGTMQSASPSWSPDGTQLTFIGYPPPSARSVTLSARSVNPDEAVYVVGVGAGGLRRLTPRGAYSEPTWSPDGTLIAFLAPHGNSPADLDDDVDVIPAGGGSIRAINDGVYAWSASYLLWRPAPGVTSASP